MWILVQTHAGKEFTASQSIQSRDEVWLPTTTEGTPAYPGYLFVRLTDHTNVRKLSGLKGVLRVVRFNETPATASDELIEGLKRTEFERESLREGDRVYIKSGPFAHIQGRIAKRHSENIDVVIELMSRPQLIRISVKEVEAA